MATANAHTHYTAARTVLDQGIDLSISSEKLAFAQTQALLAIYLVLRDLYVQQRDRGPR